MLFRCRNWPVNWRRQGSFSGECRVPSAECRVPSAEWRVASGEWHPIPYR
jgi:hypothetical protein